MSDCKRIEVLEPWRRHLRPTATLTSLCEYAQCRTHPRTLPLSQKMARLTFTYLESYQQGAALRLEATDVWNPESSAPNSLSKCLRQQLAG